MLRFSFWLGLMVLVLGSAATAWTFGINRFAGRGRLEKFYDRLDAALSPMNGAGPLIRLASAMEDPLGKCRIYRYADLYDASRGDTATAIPFTYSLPVTFDKFYRLVCILPENEKPIVIQPITDKATLTVRRRWRSAGILSVQAGKIRISGFALNFYLRVPAQDIKVHSDQETTIDLQFPGGVPLLRAQAGNLDFTRVNRAGIGELATPLRVEPAPGIKLMNEGKPLPEGVPVNILPSGVALDTPGR